MVYSIDDSKTLRHQQILEAIASMYISNIGRRNAGKQNHLKGIYVHTILRLSILS